MAPRPAVNTRRRHKNNLAPCVALDKHSFFFFFCVVQMLERCGVAQAVRAAEAAEGQPGAVNELVSVGIADQRSGPGSKGVHLVLEVLLSILPYPLPPLLTSAIFLHVSPCPSALSRSSRPVSLPPSLPSLLPHVAGAAGAVPVPRAPVLLLVPLHPRHAGLREASAAGNEGGREAFHGPPRRRGARVGAPAGVQGGQRLRGPVFLAAHPRTGV